MINMKPLFIVGLLVQSTFAMAGDFAVSSADFNHDGSLSVDQVFNGFGCKGGNISPALAWEGVPADTKSLAVTVFDPDAPTGSGWWHWVVLNLPATTTDLAKGAGNQSGRALPTGAIQVRTDFSTSAFGGACPPVGDKPHRYVFTVYALKTATIDIPSDASAALAGFMINANLIEKASVTATYGR